MGELKVYAIIPARSGSKGLLNKNIRKIDNKPLIAYSIDFAKNCSFIDRVFCSTDSEEYSEIAREYGAEVPFLRSAEAASDSAMEEHILSDIRVKFKAYGIEEPDLIVWLRPTFVFRSKGDVEKCVTLLKENKEFTAARTVVRAENRLYSLNNGLLEPQFTDLGRSMIRRQEMRPSYKVFSTDVFRFLDNPLGSNFLGNRIFGVETTELCGLDIDGMLEFEIVRLLIENKLVDTNIL